MSDRFALTYVGSLYGSRDAAPVFAAISRLIEQRAIDRDRFEVRLVGNVWMAGMTGAHRRIPVRTVGYVDHRRAVSEMHGRPRCCSTRPSSIRDRRARSSSTCFPAARSCAWLGARTWRIGWSRSSARAWSPHPTIPSRSIVRSSNSMTAGVTAAAGRSRVRERALARFSRRVLTGELAHVLDDADAGELGSGGRRANQQRPTMAEPADLPVATAPARHVQILWEVVHGLLRPVPGVARHPPAPAAVPAVLRRTREQRGHCGRRAHSCTVGNSPRPAGQHQLRRVAGRSRRTHLRRARPPRSILGPPVDRTCTPRPRATITVVALHQ